MEDSVTYQAIVRKGQVREARRLILLQGQKKFGPPDEQTRAAVDGLEQLPQLEELFDRLLEVTSWQELLASLPS